MIKAIGLFFYTVTFNVIVQAFSILFYLFSKATHNLFLSVLLLSLTVSTFSNFIEFAVTKKLQINKRYKRFIEHRNHIEATFSGKVRMVYLLGLIKVFRNGLSFEFARNISLIFKIFLFIPAFIFLNEQIQDAASDLSPHFIFNIDPYSTLKFAHLNILPFVMFFLSLISGLVSNNKAHTKLGQHIALSLVFLIMLYPSKSILVIYWCMNITFSMFINNFVQLLEKDFPKT